MTFFKFRQRRKKKETKVYFWTKKANLIYLKNEIISFPTTEKECKIILFTYLFFLIDGNQNLNLPYFFSKEVKRNNNKKRKYKINKEHPNHASTRQPKLYSTKTK